MKSVLKVRDHVIPAIRKAVGMDHIKSNKYHHNVNAALVDLVDFTQFMIQDAIRE